MRNVALVLVIAAAALTARPATAADPLSVADIGSFHVGGRGVSLSGLPTKDVVFTAGSAPIKVDPNGDFEVEQMYVQYVKLARPIVVHSQGGNIGFNAGLTAPDTVKALIAIEPSGTPKPETAAGGKLKDVPHLVGVGRLHRAEPPLAALPPRVAAVHGRAPRGGRRRRLAGAAQARRLRQRPRADDGQELRPGRPDDPEVDDRQGPDELISRARRRDRT